MTGSISTERAFSLPAFEGLRLIRRYWIEQPELEIGQIILLIEKLEADGKNLDLQASAYLATIVGTDCSIEGKEFYQECIKAILEKHQPIWARLMRAGRKRFVRKLDDNDQDIFAAAGLMDERPDPIVVNWWDGIGGQSRLLTDKEKMLQAREAELLSIKHEENLLEQQKIELRPQWPGLDDNYAGYDVLSYEKTEHGVVNKMIEVKSTNVSPIKFFVTKNEWKQAQKSGSAYIFHVWNMKANPPELHVKTVEQVEPHIPSDNGNGEWSSASIPLGSG